MDASRTQASLKHIAEVLQRCRHLEGQVLSFEHSVNCDEAVTVFDRMDALAQKAEAVTLLKHVLKRYAPPGFADIEHDDLSKLIGAVVALEREVDAGRLDTFRQIVRSELFSDFLEMAEHFVEDEGLKDPAAVMAGGVLEQHLRKLCDIHGVPRTETGKGGNPYPKKLDKLNADLAKAGAYGGNEQKQITAWAGIRNNAAHAQYDEYDRQTVALMIQGVRHFMSTHPA